MIKHISPKLAQIIKENAELQSLISHILYHANYMGLKGKNNLRVEIHVKKKNWLLLRFWETAWIEWVEND